MELISFTTSGSKPRVGALVNEQYLLDFASAYTGEPPTTHLEWLDMDGPWFHRSRDVWEQVARDPGELERARASGWLVPRKDAWWFAPVPRPGKIVCIGLNYRDHAAELNMPIPDRPIVFSKFTTAVIAPGEAIVLPPDSGKVDFEAELAIVIGRRTKQVTAAHALDYVLGFTAFNDVTARDFQSSDGQWQRSKSCDTFAPMGPSIVTGDIVGDASDLSIRLVLNGTTMQHSSTSQLIFSVPSLIEFVSRTITLEPGDIIATGTPPGVGAGHTPPVFLKAGDTVEVEIERVGRLSNPVAAA